jgi:hypothetical protein
MDSLLGQCPSWPPSWLLGGPCVLLLYVGWTQVERSEARGQGAVSECHVVEILSGPADFELVFVLPTVFRGGPVYFGVGE